MDPTEKGYQPFEEGGSVETVASEGAEVPAEGDGPLRPEETCIIFDWDDTLLSSSWLAHNGLRLDAPEQVPPEAAALLAVLEESVAALLERALRCGSVVIITNAETGWVELSCRRFLPRCVPVVSRIRVISARSTYETLHPDSPADWKVQAFFTELCAAYSGRRPDARKNVLSFGDSVHERAAVHRVTAGLGPATRTKSVKFVERPTLEQLKRQVDLVASCFEDIVRHDGHLDLMLTISLIYVGENEGGMGMGMGMGAGAAAASSSSGGGSPLLEDGAADAVGGGAGAGMAMGIDAGTAASSSMMAGLMTA